MLGKKGVSLIEILVAVIIFSVGILTILNVIGKNISTVDKIKLKTNATFLAKEGLELAYNLRDSNLDKGLSWSCTMINSNYDCIDEFAPGNIYNLNLDLRGFSEINPSNSGFDDNRLYYHEQIITMQSGQPILSGFWYDHDDTGDSTNYSRYIIFDSLYLEGDGGNGDEDKVLKISSVVNYKKGAFTGSVVLDSIIGER